jgi:ribonuclease HII
MSSTESAVSTLPKHSGSHILGIDEVGRGAIIGPLVLCGVAVPGETRDYLLAVGVRDSKRVKGQDSRKTLAKRTALAQKISKIVGFQNIFFEVIPAFQIDHRRSTGSNLDEIEREGATEIIHRARLVVPTLGHVVLDGSQMFSRDQLSLLKRKGRAQPEILALDKADTLEISVAAASICAKFLRDTLVKEIMGDRYFFKGAGYPNAGTKHFLEDRYDYARTLREIRTSFNWSPAHKIANGKKQTRKAKKNGTT